MKVVIQFYRTRVADDAHAVVGRETVDAADLDAAIEIARLLARTLNMPNGQMPSPLPTPRVRRSIPALLLRRVTWTKGRHHERQQPSHRCSSRIIR
ncbi:hypothetical protein [Mesorhizobium japonicum]|uniref:hypothetical protein n=1 Tax=Mesorhizobium TaxID=68287 RepID=UPI000A424252